MNYEEKHENSFNYFYNFNSNIILKMHILSTALVKFAKTYNYTLHTDYYLYNYKTYIILASFRI